MTAISPERFAEMARQAAAAYPGWVAWMRRVNVPINQETLMVCDCLPAMAEGIFMAGYTTALVDQHEAEAAVGEREG